MSANRVPLRSVCVQDRTSVRPGERGDLIYLGLEGIEAGTGQFVGGDLSKTPETPQANSFLFSSRHVLYGKLRPYLNKVALPDTQGKCSTEIVPLLPAEDLDRRYLAYYLRSPRTVAQITDRSSGARMPRADMDFVLSLEIPLPHLQDQRRIVDLLSRAEGIVRLRREAQQKAAELIPANFIDMFGDPASNPKGWSVTTLGDVLAAADYGSSTKASQTDSGLPIIRMGNVTTAGDLDLDDLKYVELSEKDADRFRLRKGDLLFNRTNSKELVGKTGLWDGRLDAVVASYFIRLRARIESAHPTYLWAWMNSRHMKRVLFDTARGAIGQANINSRELRALAVAVPPLALQEAFDGRVQDVESIRVQQAGSLGRARAVFEGLLSGIFR
jgi:type I restriction enzyme, S subunit